MSFRICVRKKSQDFLEETVSDHHNIHNETWIMEPFPHSLEIVDPEHPEVEVIDKPVKEPIPHSLEIVDPEHPEVDMIDKPVKEPYYGLDIIANWKTKNSFMNFVEPIGKGDPEPEMKNPYFPDSPGLGDGNSIIPTEDLPIYLPNNAANGRIQPIGQCFTCSTDKDCTLDGGGKCKQVPHKFYM